MKRPIRWTLLLLTAAIVACAPRERTLIILSTNDMHAKIQRFPQLAAAVKACRDTSQLVLLVDAGDRWTGNAYVDKVPTPGMPIIALMNRLGYDAGTLGNHEFDHGQAFLGRMIDSMDFEVICANVQTDTCTFPALPPCTVIEREGIRIGLVGVVTNYEGPGHPAGHASSFEGLRFPDPQQMALQYAGELRPKTDVLVLVSHMGDDRDMELLAGGTPYDAVIGGHTHVLRDTMINGTLLTQTGKDLYNLGVTEIRMRGNKIREIGYRNVPLAGYAPDAEFTELVKGYYAEPGLNRPVGVFEGGADKWGLCNWMADAVSRAVRADVGFYHVGGVRIDSIPAGGVGTAKVYDMEPFGTKIAVVRMTPADMRRMILAKYNDTVNLKEAHRIDLISSTPYVLDADAADRATDVRFPKLREGRTYKVAMSDYIYKNYKDLNYTDGEVREILVADILLNELRKSTALHPDNTPRQQVRRPE